MVNTRTAGKGKAKGGKAQKQDDRLTPAERQILELQKELDKKKEEVHRLKRVSKHKKRSPQETPRANKKPRYYAHENRRGNPKNDEDYETEEMSDNEEEAADQLLVSTKPDNGTGTWAVTESSGELKYLYSELKDNQWKNIKFLSNEQQKHELMDRIVANTSRGDRLRALSPTDRKIQIQAYLNLYGSRILTCLNGQRSQLQQGLKNAWKAMKAQGIRMTAEDCYLASQRFGIDVLPEKSGNGKKITKNVKANKENQKFRDNFDNYNVYVIGAIGGHSWKEPHFVKMPIQGDLEAALDPGITVDDEAMAVLIFMNCEWKWELQSTLVDGRFPPGHEHAGKKAKKKHFICPFTRSDVGSNQLSGWNKAGREKFVEVRRQIKHGRNRPGALDAEWQSRSRLYLKYGWDKKEKPKKKGGLKLDLSNTVVAFGDQDVEEEEVTGVKLLDQPIIGDIVFGDSDNEEKVEDKSKKGPDAPAADPKDDDQDKDLENQGEGNQAKEEDLADETRYQVDANGEFVLDDDGQKIEVDDDSATEGEEDDEDEEGAEEGEEGGD